MGLFTILKGGKQKEHPTIGEKKEYYKKRTKDKNLTDSQRKYASKKLQELNELTEKKKAVSKNFVGKDGELTGNKKEPDKIRYGICTRVREDGSLNINPFMPEKESEIEKKQQLKVKAQEKTTGKRHAVRVRATPKINIDNLCEDKDFPEKDTRILTKTEFQELKKLSKGNKKKRKL